MIVPKHIGFIMDGNGRWATQRGMTRSAGHKAGFEKIPEVLETCHDLGVHIVSGFAWSTENWGRPKAEVAYIMQSLEKHLPNFVNELHKRSVRFTHCGSREKMSERALRVIDDGVELTKENGPCVFNFVFNYGGRAELLHVVRSVIDKGIRSENVSKPLIEKHLWSADLPDVNLLIRTGGDYRTSNFMLWQTAYSCLYFIDNYWPAITKEDIENGIAYYNKVKLNAS
jgi:undecaprenyl diphosphate synthase